MCLAHVQSELYWITRATFGYFIAIATTQLGVWLIRDLHRVSQTVSDLTQSSLIYMCVYPLIDAIVS